MELATIRSLASTPPPKFGNARAANAELRRLEAELSLPPGNFLGHVGRANARIAELHRISASPRPSGPRSNAGDAAVLKSYAAVTDPARRVAFYRENSEAIDSAFKAAIPRLPSSKPVKAAIITEMESITDPISKIEFYRQHATEIDRAYRDLNK